MFKSKPPSNASEVERHGLFVLFPPSDGTTWDVDIVVLHGLGGDAYTTWTADNKIMWPRDFIPQVVPTARVMTFGYDSKWAFSPSTADIKDFALDLLNRLRNKRWSADEMNHPIIFICHSLGGIVCKQALLLAQSLPFYNNIFEKTTSILFFGCPHRGSRVASWGTVAANVINSSTFHKPVQKGLLADLSLSSKILADISAAFKEVVGDIDIKTFYETAIMLPLKGPVVERDSAVLGLPTEQIIPIAANHREMVRFASITSEKFDPVKFALREAKDGRPMDSRSAQNAIMYLTTELNVADYDKQLSRVGVRYRGTCEWLPSHSSFKSWFIEPRNDLLWLRGYAGVGKSVITKYLITDVFSAQYTISKKAPVTETAQDSNNGHFVAYFFCSERHRHLQSERNILLSILHQFLCAAPLEVSKALQSFRRASADYTFLRSTVMLWEAVKAAVIATNWTTIYFVFDGLDEMLLENLSSFAKGLKALVDAVAPRIEPRNLKALVTSRPIGSLEEELDCPSISVRSERDVRYFVQGSTDELAQRYDLSHQLQNEIVDQISEKARGMFLWAVLAWYELCRGAKRPEDFAANLLKMQQLPATLETLYEDILNRLPQSSRRLALKAFPWLTLSARPLHTNELRFAVAMDYAGDTYRDTSQRMISEQELKTLCPELVSVGVDGYVQFVHSSIKDFFLSPTTNTQYRIDPIKLHSDIAIICLRSLYMPGYNPKDIQTELCNRQILTESAMINLPVNYFLLPYAATNWNYHAAMAGEDLKVWDAFRRLMDSAHSTKLWLMLSLFDGSLSAQRGWYISKDFWERLIVPAPIHIAVFLKNLYFIKKLVENGASINQLNTGWRNAAKEYCRPHLPDGGTVLHSANLNIEILQVLIELGADMNVPDSRGTTALSRAVGERDEDKVVMLLGFAKRTRAGTSTIGYDPQLLNLAAAATMKKVVAVILDDPLIDLSHERFQHQDKSILGIYHSSPLEHACLLGLESIANIMMNHPRMVAAQKRLELRSRNRNPTSLAFLTTLQGWGDLTLIALQNFQTDLDRERDMNQRTILMHAAMEEWHYVLEHCIGRLPKSRLNMQDKNGMTALHHAAKMRNWFGTEKLIAAGADYHMEDNEGYTPAHGAAEAGSDRVLRIILDQRAFGIDSVDHKKRTILHYVATWNLHSITETLIDIAPNQVTAKDFNGRTPLHLAALFGSTAVLSMLLSTGLVDVNAQDHFGKTLLHLAVESRIESCIDELLSRQATDLNMMDRMLRTPLDITVAYKDQEEASKIRIMLEDAGCRPGYWRPRRAYGQYRSVSDNQIPKEVKDRSGWQLVRYDERLGKERETRYDEDNKAKTRAGNTGSGKDEATIRRKPVPPPVPPRKSA